MGGLESDSLPTEPGVGIVGKLTLGDGEASPVGLDKLLELEPALGNAAVGKLRLGALLDSPTLNEGTLGSDGVEAVAAGCLVAEALAAGRWLRLGSGFRGT